MTYAKSTKEILKKIGCDKLSLRRGRGYYWYFTYDAADFFETETVLVPNLRDMKLDQWVEIGTAFVKKIESEV